MPSRLACATAVFGDSAAEAAFLQDDPAFVNLALGAEPLRLSLLKIKHYFAEIEPGRIVLDAHHQTLTREDERYDSYDYEELFARQSRAPLRLMETHHRNLLFDALLTWLMESRVYPPIKTFPNGGVTAVAYDPVHVADRLSHAEERATDWIPVPERRQNAVLYEEMLGWFRDRGAEVCIVTYPTAPQFRAVADRHPEYADLRAWYGEAAERHGFLYRDYWDAFENSRDFSDSTHVSEQGGRKVAAMILRDCFGIESGAGGS